MRILKFVEVKENNDLTKLKSNQEDSSAINSKKEAQTTQNKNDNEGNIEQNNSVGESDHDSIGSLNEEVRLLKDFMALISEKTTPKSLIILARTVIFLGIVLIILISINLNLNFTKSDDISEGVYAVFQAYQRHNVLADINFNIRQLQLLAL